MPTPHNPNARTAKQRKEDAVEVYSGELRRTRAMDFAIRSASFLNITTPYRLKRIAAIIDKYITDET